MPIEVDPRFAGTGRKARQRQRVRLFRRFGLPLIGGIAVISVIAVIVMALRGGGGEDTEVAIAGAGGGADDEAVFIQSEDTAQARVDLAAAASDVFLNIRGEPMIIQLPDTGDGAGMRRVVLSSSIEANRARVGTEVRVVEDLLLDGGTNVQLTLPSSSADLAAFQARRATALNVGAVQPVADAGVVEEGSVVTVDDSDGSWGDVVGTGEDEVSYVETSIGNITTQVEATRTALRRPLFEERILRGRADTDLAALMASTGVSENELQRLTGFLEGTAAREGLDPAALMKPAAESVIALRLVSDRPEASILQMSFYAPDRYLTSVAQVRAGRFEGAADPWLGEDLLRRVRAEQRTIQERGDVRLKDALYSAALRNGLPSELVGELLVMLSRSQDLDRIAGRQDRFRVLYAPEGGASSLAGQILFASLQGPDLDFKCYVLQPNDDAAPFGCYDANRPSGGGGFLIPVAGTKTSGFGPRNHPILKRTVNHNGVDWGAPTGTPVKATAAGRVSVAGVGGGYGNVVYIRHAGGVESRYAHLDAFATGISAGTDVAAGQVIGYVGTTGRSTGPHLHFEIHLNGTPVDPITLLSGGGGVMASGGASGAVEALVAQIIRVESAGNARAKNPLSTATGLGQFIESTWLRMMRTYRPDLVATLSRAEQLELRFDPALSRAMVTNLARENEAFLRARGHAITPGRLYLAHFLGPAGANTALKANPEATVLEVMGAGVVNANPFLRGRNVRWMTDWSDRKMSRVTGGRVVAAAPATPAPEPEAVKRYKEAIDGLIEAL